MSNALPDDLRDAAVSTATSITEGAPFSPISTFSASGVSRVMRFCVDFCFFLFSAFYHIVMNKDVYINVRYLLTLY